MQTTPAYTFAPSDPLKSLIFTVDLEAPSDCGRGLRTHLKILFSGDCYEGGRSWLSCDCETTRKFKTR